MKIIIYQGSEELNNHNYNASISMLGYASLSYEIVIDVKSMMMRSKGRVNPSQGFVIIPPPEAGQVTTITNCVELALWIDRQGLNPL